MIENEYSINRDIKLLPPQRTTNTGTTSAARLPDRHQITSRVPAELRPTADPGQPINQQPDVNLFLSTISHLSPLIDVEPVVRHGTPAMTVTVVPVILPPKGHEGLAAKGETAHGGSSKIDEEGDASTQGDEMVIGVESDKDKATKSDAGPQREYYTPSARSSSADLSEAGRRPSVSKDDEASVEEQLVTADQLSLGSADVFREPSRRRAATRSERTPASSNPSRKGKERALTDGGVQFRDVRRGIDVVRSGTHSKRTDSSLASVERRLPLRTRRIGALGISVSSESEDGSRKMREMDWSADDRGSTDLDSVGALVRASNRIGTNESHFRGIVDDLTVQSIYLSPSIRSDLHN